MEHTSRRGLMVGLAALAATGGAAVAAVPASPDAVLLAICAAAEEADDKCEAADQESEGLKRGDPRRSAANERCDEFFDVFCAELDRAQLIPARTREGVRAKARLALRNSSTTSEDPDGFNQSFLRELAGRA